MKLQPLTSESVKVEAIDVFRPRVVDDTGIHGLPMLGVDPNGDFRIVKVDNEGRVLVRIVDE